jgi:uncharacterized protein YbaR (Trm112 family)
MFIELTDHLRCPEDHDEAFLVLLPDEVVGRSVRTGTLGCPVCERRFTLRDGAFDIGGAPPVALASSTRLTADAIAALAGLSGPGGYLVLVGAPAASWQDVAERIPGVGLVAVNPPDDVVDEEGLSVLRGGRLALKSRSMRGVVLGSPFGDAPAWVGEAGRVVLPGLRVLGEGAQSPPSGIDLMASADGVWVGTPRR